MKKFLLLAPILLLLLSAEYALACSCVAPDPDKTLEQQVAEAYQEAGAVFSAKVLSVTKLPAEGKTKVKVKLVKSWKGKLTKTLTIITGLDSAGCGYEFEKGKTYLIYAYRDEDKKLNTNLCLRTAGITSNQDVAVLDKLKKKKA
jgi:hypothetical protein